MGRLRSPFVGTPTETRIDTSSLDVFDNDVEGLYKQYKAVESLVYLSVAAGRLKDLAHHLWYLAQTTAASVADGEHVIEHELLAKPVAMFHHEKRLGQCLLSRAQEASAKATEVATLVDDATAWLNAYTLVPPTPDVDVDVDLPDVDSGGLQINQ